MFSIFILRERERTCVHKQGEELRGKEGKRERGESQSRLCAASMEPALTNRASITCAKIKSWTLN